MENCQNNDRKYKDEMNYRKEEILTIQYIAVKFDYFLRIQNSEKLR